MDDATSTGDEWAGRTCPNPQMNAISNLLTIKEIKRINRKPMILRKVRKPGGVPDYFFNLKNFRGSPGTTGTGLEAPGAGVHEPRSLDSSKVAPLSNQ